MLPGRTLEIIKGYNMARPGDRLGVAVSGGADSVSLLHILHGLAAELGVNLNVLHVNHALRGAKSEEDEQFVRELAAKLGLTFVVERRRPEPGNLEEEAREVRLTFFARLMEEGLIDRVVLGHTRSDQAETVLFRILRGTGPPGLGAMRFVSQNGLIRPFLAFSRDEVRQWATGQGLAWREDSSNQDQRFTRNRLRRETLPALASAYNPRLESALAGLAELAGAEEEYWQGLVEAEFGRLASPHRLGITFAVPSLAALHPAVLRRLVRRAIADIRPEGLTAIDFSHVEAIGKLCTAESGHDRVRVPGIDALRSYSTLLLTDAQRLSGEGRGYRLNLELNCVQALPAGAGFIQLSSPGAQPEICDNHKEGKSFSCETVLLRACAAAGEPGLAVRNWEPGDALRRSGHQSTA